MGQSRQTSSTTANRPPPTASGNAPPSPPLFPNLPDDIAIQCIARVPRPYHAYFSLVSKSWRHTIRSPPFFAARSLLHSTQHSLYLYIRHTKEQSIYLNIPPDNIYKWYHHPNPNPNYKLLLSPIPPPPILLVGSAYAVLGHKLYVIGGSFRDRKIPLTQVLILNCRLNKWEYGPSMKVGRQSAIAATVNGKIYVMSGCSVDDEIQSDNWAEVYDPEVGVWCALPSSDVETKYKWMQGNAVIDGKIYALTYRGGVVYDVVEMKWGRLPEGLASIVRSSVGVIDGVYYSYTSGIFRWYDVEKDVWRELRGVKNVLPKFIYGARMLELDGRLCVVWDCKRGGARGKVRDIMCAVINVCKDEDGGLSGSVLWVDAIFSIPLTSSIEHCMTVAL